MKTLPQGSAIGLGLALLIPAASALAQEHAGVRLRLIGEQHFDSRAEYLGTRIGGLSGIDYDPDWGFLIAMSDDSGEYAPPRAYLGTIELEPDRIVGLEWTNVLKMHWGSGDLIDVTLDPESVRFVPHNEPFGEPTLLFVSEGDARKGVEPRIYEMCSGATRMDEWPAPRTHVAPSARSRTGVRHNRAFESVAVVGDRVAVVANESPLMQDGPEASASGVGYVRLTTYDLHDPMAEAIAEVAYPVGPVPSSLPMSQTGLVDLVALDGGRLLALERSFTLAGEHDARLFVVETSGATDVLGVESLAGAEFVPATKTLVGVLSELAPTVLNVEGLCFGPPLDDGTPTLLLVSDSNFMHGVPTVLTALAVESDGGLVRPLTIDFDAPRPISSLSRP